MLIYQRRDIFFQALHPATTLAYLAVVVAGSVLLTHPLYLLALFLSVFAALAASGGMEDWRKSVRLFLTFMAVIMVLNTLINQTGSTVLFRGPLFAPLGRVVITLEAIIYALVMGIRLLTVFTAFMLFNQAVNPDRLLAMFALLFPRSALLVALATKTVPYLLQKMQSAAEIAQCRGVNFHTGSRLVRVRNRLPLIRVLFMSALEDSFNIGESIQARVYGSGPRTSYFRHRWRPGDFVVLIAALAALLLIVLSLLWGWGMFSYYPRLDQLIVSPQQAASLLGMGALLMIPALVAWGWSKWNFMRWKI